MWSWCRVGRRRWRWRCLKFCRGGSESVGVGMTCSRLISSIHGEARSTPRSCSMVGEYPATRPRRCRVVNPTHMVHGTDTLHSVSRRRDGRCLGSGMRSRRTFEAIGGTLTDSVVRFGREVQTEKRCSMSSGKRRTLIEVIRCTCGTSVSLLAINFQCNELDIT